LLAAAVAHAQEGTNFTVEDLVRLRRVSDPQLSPDGRYVAFAVRETDIEADRGRSDLWLIDLRMAGGAARRLTQHPANDTNPRWAPDGSGIFFLSTRSGSSQVWRLPLDGGEASQVTDYALDVGSLRVSPAGNRLALSLDVAAGCVTLACTKEKLGKRAMDKTTGRLYEQLFVRHWDKWSDGTRSHLFIAELGADGKASAPVDLMPQLDGDVPSKPNGGDEEYAFSPDGSRIVFSARVAGRGEAWSTNFDLYEVPAAGSTAPRNLTAGNPAWDTQPVFLANGDLAYLAMQRPGFEADRFHVMLRSASDGSLREIARDWDVSVSRLDRTADGRRLFATGDSLGQHALFVLDPARERESVRTLVSEGQVTEYSAGPQGIVFAWASLGAPADVWIKGLGSDAPRQLTTFNADILSKRRLSAYERFSFKGWNDETVHGYVMKPYGFKAGAKYPIAFIVHGGPQVSFQNQWNYRWNAQSFAGRGYAVVFIDFHGSPGYGQKFTDSISEDWGGKPLVDLQKGLAAAVERFPWLDGSRACSLGASYGGYMQNWIAGQWSDRFRCLVNHAGIFDSRTMYYTTEELWFTEWENGGPYYQVPAKHEQFNPANFVDRWRTPTLVIHGALDFRVPYSQGLATFTALQRRGIDSRLLFFPDENHWILKPANSVLWYGTVLDWLDKHLR
jgi:dipeptidyl aminopeptidase/acylaminoacyl peptidase